MEVEVGLIDQHDGVRGGGADGQQVLATHDSAGGVVGRGDDDELGARSDGGEKSLEGKLERRVRLHAREASGHHERADLEHEEGGRGDERLVGFLEECGADQVDGFIYAVGQQHLVRLQAEVRGSDALDGLALGIPGEALGGDLAQALEHAGRRGECIFVEVEAQGIAAGQRRAILRHGEHGATRLRNRLSYKFRGGRLICNFFGF